jgi:hypothetical protein
MLHEMYPWIDTVKESKCHVTSVYRMTYMVKYRKHEFIPLTDTVHSKKARISHDRIWN